MIEMKIHMYGKVSHYEYLSTPKRTRQEAAASVVQYLHPLATRHGKSIVSASTCTINSWKYMLALILHEHPLELTGTVNQRKWKARRGVLKASVH